MVCPIIDGSDMLLVNQLKAGDPAAIRLLYHTHHRWVFAKVYSVLKDYCETEELVQDVFTEVYYSIHTYGMKCSLKGWMYRITVNKSINKLRYLNAARRKRELPLLPELLSAISDQIEAISTNDHGAPYITIEELIDLMDELPERQRMALTYCKLRQKSYSAAAAMMNCTEDSIRGLLQRAKHSLCYMIDDRKKLKR